MHLLIRLRRVIRRFMPEQPDPHELSASDVDEIIAQSIEEATGQRNHGNIAANLAALRKRLDYCRRELHRLSACPAADESPEWVAREMARIRQDKAAVEQRLTDLETQQGQAN